MLLLILLVPDSAARRGLVARHSDAATIAGTSDFTHPRSICAFEQARWPL